MKTFIFTSILALSSFASATEYKCETQSCSWSDGCQSTNHYILIEGSSVRYWMDLSYHGEVDYSDIRNANKNQIHVGKLEAQALENGNYAVAGPGLMTKTDALFPNFLYRENEIYASLIEGQKYGRMIERTHFHRANNPNIENKPTEKEYKCTLLEE